MELSGVARESEPDLIQEARQGDGAAWEALMRLHQQPVFRFAYLLLGDADEAEDAAQETFIRAYRSLDRFDVTRPMRPWLLSIAANLSKNRRRSAGRYLAALRRLLQAEPDPKINAEIKISQREQSQELWRAIRHLNHTDQQVVYLRFFLELPVDEVAEVIGVAPGTVKSRLHRALQRLRAVIQRDFPGLQEGILE